MGRVRTYGRLTVDQDARQVALDGMAVSLTRSQFDLLMTLVERAGTAVSNRELLEAMWETEWRTDTTPVQVHISRLRHKLGESGSRPRHIVTVHGYGYRFDPDPPAVSGVRDDASATSWAESPIDDQTSEVTLTYDRRLLLRAITPLVAVLGWEPAEIIGTYFSPSGMDRPAAKQFLKHLRSISMVEMHGRFAALDRHGENVWIMADLTIDLDQHGHFDGVRARWRLPARAPEPTRLDGAWT